jgi:hypothetical protein
MNQYRIIAKTGRTVNTIRLRADDIEQAIDKAIATWINAGVLSESEIHFTNFKCEEV